MQNRPKIVSISIPNDSQDSGCAPKDDRIWASQLNDQGNIDTTRGIGALISQSETRYVLHDHHYKCANVPDSERAIITFKFSQPVIIDAVLIQQHTNGITFVKGYVGDANNAYVSIGSAWGPQRDLMEGGKITEGSWQMFKFNSENSRQGTIFKLCIKKTNLHNGFACYKIIPITTY